ncbi:MAG: Ldh family oxidoreductase [Oscillospiraceae bacterium]|nr:Ldh family oxidoreductase [Oscillospiraceae bacterium]
MLIKYDDAREMCISIFLGAGASPSEAEIVSDGLVESNLMGVDSHGMIRIPQYLGEVKSGAIVPGAPVEVIFQTPNSAIVDGNHNFGMVCAEHMVMTAIRKAESANIAVVSSRHCNHVGRLGAYTCVMAESGLFAFACANGGRHGHLVTPFGGLDGRLSTNPISYAAPTSSDPIVLDMSTSTIAEGKIRLMQQQGRKIPPMCAIDADGNETDDPSAFYGPPMGRILPLGGPFGYKGYGLSMMVEILGSALSGVGPKEEYEGDSYMNGFFILAISPAVFNASGTFVGHVDALKEYVLSSRPREGHGKVSMPGEPDFSVRADRMEKGIPIADGTWETIALAAESVGVDARRYG